MGKIFTSESVSEGHPDKICDRISDAILDAFLEKDPDAKVACETLITKDTVVIAGEVNSDAVIDVDKLVRTNLKEIGYTSEEIGINADTCSIINV
jgi:S-adenosylmethionine synthetase